MKSVYLMLIALGGYSWTLSAQSKRIVTYIEDVQEERRSTRWTLTQWLLIKERMKMMDVWLAMFSDPKKDRFAPEFNLTYGQGLGSSRFRLGPLASGADDRTELHAEHRDELGQVQFWFTNLVSSTTGLRTLDIDLGIEGAVQNRFMDVDQVLEYPAGTLLATTGTEQLQRAGLNFRIFGANTQDSSLVAKIGQFRRHPGYTGAWEEPMEGRYLGGELTLYLLTFLGAEGQYYHYKTPVDENALAEGSQSEYMGFLEIYNLRLGYGVYQRDWRMEENDRRLDIQQQGRYYLLRLYF